MSTLVLVLRVIFSLVVVLGILSVAARYASRRGMGGAPRRTGTHIEVVARQGLGRNSSVVVVRAAERALVLGVTETNITLLADADLGVLELPTDAPGMVQPVAGPMVRPSAWKDTLEHLRDRTVRRS